MCERLDSIDALAEQAQSLLQPGQPAEAVSS
jgi:hypothetical protein